MGQKVWFGYEIVCGLCVLFVCAICMGFMYEFISNMTKVGWFHIWIHVRHQKGRSWGGGRAYIYIYMGDLFCNYWDQLMFSFLNMHMNICFLIEHMLDLTSNKFTWWCSNLPCWSRKINPDSKYVSCQDPSSPAGSGAAAAKHQRRTHKFCGGDVEPPRCWPNNKRTSGRSG